MDSITCNSTLFEYKLKLKNCRKATISFHNCFFNCSIERPKLQRSSRICSLTYNLDFVNLMKLKLSNNQEIDIQVGRGICIHDKSGHISSLIIIIYNLSLMLNIRLNSI